MAVPEVKNKLTYTCKKILSSATTNQISNSAFEIVSHSSNKALHATLHM
jgi:hypothetical protein